MVLITKKIATSLTFLTEYFLLKINMPIITVRTNESPTYRKRNDIETNMEQAIKYAADLLSM